MTPPASAAVGLVVPVFEEADRVGDFAPALADFVAGQPAGSTLTFVDDGSTDGTADRLEEILTRFAVDATVVRRPHLGKGAAVSLGLGRVASGIGAFCDVDLSTPLEELQKVIDTAGTGKVMAIGSRDLDASTLMRRESRIRESLGRTYNRLLQATVTPGIVDTQCGAKAAPASVWARVLPHCRQVGFAWDAEVIAVCQATGIPVHEVAISWRHDDRSKVRVGRDGFDMVRQTPKIWASARRAGRVGQTGPPLTDGVFEGAQADELLGADRSHWWFRSKAALVSTALARTGGTGGTLFDVGAGAGGVTSMLDWDQRHVVVLEGSEPLADHARRVLGLPTIRGTVEALPLADGTADVVCLLDVIEHLAQPGLALAEAGRLLRPGGRLVVNVPAHQWLWSEADVHLGHHRRYDRPLLRVQLHEAGLEPVFLGHVFTWLVPAVWFERRLRRAADPALGLERSSPLIDRAADVLTTIERTTVGRWSLPVGTSLLCVARRIQTGS